MKTLNKKQRKKLIETIQRICECHFENLSDCVDEHDIYEFVKFNECVKFIKNNKNDTTSIFKYINDKCDDENIEYINDEYNDHIDRDDKNYEFIIK